MSMQRDAEVATCSPVSTNDVENATIINLVSEGVASILARLHSKSHDHTLKCHMTTPTHPPPDLAEFEDGKSKVTLLVSEAVKVENICRMDPAWNPWM